MTSEIKGFDENNLNELDGLTDEQRTALFDHAMQEFLDIHDRRIISETLITVMDLLDTMELADNEKLEFLKLTERGKIQREGSDITLKRLRKMIMAVILDIQNNEGKFF